MFEIFVANEKAWKYINIIIPACTLYCTIMQKQINKKKNKLHHLLLNLKYLAYSSMVLVQNKQLLPFLYECILINI